MRTGSNIRQRKDGRYEARYIKSRDENGKIIWGYCYGLTYEEAEEKRNRITSQNLVARKLNLLILGAGDHGKEVRNLAEKLRMFDRISFLDDNSKEGVLGKCEKFEQYLEEYPVAIAAVGDNALRMKWMIELSKSGFVIPTFVHPNATIPEDTKIEQGTVICSGATVGIDVQIGKGCIIDSGAVIERHTLVPDWTLISCGEIFRGEGENA